MESVQRLIMKRFSDYLQESEQAADTPVAGDTFAINIREECLIESVVLDQLSDGVVIAADEKMISLLESYGYTFEENCMECGMTEGCGCDQSTDNYSDETEVEDEDAGEYDFEGDMAKDDLRTMIRAARRLTGMLDDDENMPEWVQSKINKATDYVDTAADYIESNKERAISEQRQDSPVVSAVLHRIMMQHTGLLATHGPEKVMMVVDELADNVGSVDEIGTSDVSGWVREVSRMLAELPDKPMDAGDTLDEAEYQGRKVKLGKPMQGDVAKSKVYVKNPQGNVVKVNFGDPDMKIKKSNPARRKSFRARHNCDNPGPRHKARYWSCRAW
jgi:hypothetical protein